LYVQNALNSPTNFFNSKDFFGAYFPGLPLKEEGRKGRGEKEKGGEGKGCVVAVGG